MANSLLTVWAVLQLAMVALVPSYAKAQAAVVKTTLGETNVEDGLVQVWQQYSDGWSEPGVLDGKTYRRNVHRVWNGGDDYPSYLYFDVRPGFLPAPGSPCWVAVEYYDFADASAPYFSLQYDSSTDPYQGRSHFRRDLSTGDPRWRWTLFYLPNSAFQGRQNGGADFRIDVFGDGNEILVHQVCVSRTPPDFVQPLLYCSDHPGESVFTAKVIQGHVNRLASQIGVLAPLSYVDLFPINGTYNGQSISTDRIWLQEYLEDHSDSAFCELDSLELIGLFKSSFSYRVIYDESRSWQRPIAATYAAVNSALIVASSEKNDIAADLPVLMDFSKATWNWPNSVSPTTQTGIGSKVAGYDWAIGNLLPLCSREQVDYLSDGLPHLLDHVYANKVFCFDLDPLNDPAQITRIKTILSNFAGMVPVYGWPDAKYATQPGQDNVTVENAAVRILTEQGVFLVASDLASNLSFLKVSANGTPTQRYLQPPRRLLRYDPTKRYIVFLFSDGDNLQYDLNKMKALWSTDISRPEKYSMDWTISPSLSRLGPWAFEHYQSALRKSLPQYRFVAGPSGAGYVRPSLLGSSALTQFVRLTDLWNQSADLSGIAAIDDTGSEDSVYRQFAGATNVDSIFMVEPQHAGQSPGQAALLPGGTNEPQVPYVIEDIRAQYQSPAQLAVQIQSAVGAGTRGNFVFVYCQAWDVTPETIAQTIDQLGSSWIAVHMDELPFLFQNSINPCSLQISEASFHGNSLRVLVNHVFDSGMSGPAIDSVQLFLSNNAGGSWTPKGTVNLGMASSVGVADLSDGDYLIQVRGAYAGFGLAAETGQPLHFVHWRASAGTNWMLY